MSTVQDKVQAMLDGLVSSGDELGIQVAVYHRGELIVDSWAGIADRETGARVDGRTLFPVFSTTKGVAATIVHILAERGLLNYDMHIAEVWPEFAACGKGSVTLRHALTHTAGVPQAPDGTGPLEAADWDAMCAKVAALPPLWPPGEHAEYHALTYGWLVGEVARRVSGRSFEQLLEEEIRRPLGLADMFVGIPAGVEARVARLEEPGYVTPELDPTAPQTIPLTMSPLYEWMNSRAGRMACVPAGSGVMAARDLARLYAALLPGGVDGVELLPPARVAAATAPVALPDGTPLTTLGGYATWLTSDRPGVNPAFGHGGYGGSVAFADPAHLFSFALTRNLFSPRDAVGPIVAEIMKSTPILQDPLR